MVMTTQEMAQALAVYIKTFKIFGADIKYDTTGGVLKGLVELPVDQLEVDEFTVRLEFYGCDSGGGRACVPMVRLMDGTSGIVKEVYPTDGHDMLLKLRVLIPPKVTKKTSDETLINVLCLLTRLLDRLVR